MDVLINPIVLSVLALCALCLCRLNVLVSLIIAAIIAGMSGGLGITKSMTVLANGFSGNATTALSYILLGTFAVAIAQTGLMQILVNWLNRHLATRPMTFCLAIAAISCLSQNVVPVHIAFIPLLIPPLLVLMNKMNLDRRAVACALGLSMLVGLLFCVFVLYRRPRTYRQDAQQGLQAPELAADTRMTMKHWSTLLAIVLAVVVQITLESLPLAALMGLAVMIAGRAFKFSELDAHVTGGISMMGFIAFVMLIAGGYAAILKETGAVNELIESVVPYIGASKVMAATIITAIGLLVTMGIGTSFGTVPILAVIYVPLCAAVGFSVPATILLITAAGALGDAGSPASDSTLGPTSGLNADGQHNHIWDTCVPTFIAYNIPLMIAGIVFAQFL